MFTQINIHVSKIENYSLFIANNVNMGLQLIGMWNKETLGFSKYRNETKQHH